MLYVKNLPNWERMARIFAGLAMVIGSFWLAAPWSWIIAGSSLVALLSGILGFCPACAMFGRE